MSKNSLKKQIAGVLRVLPKKMRYRLLRRMISLPDFPEDLSFEIARTREDLDAAFAILYDSYLKEGITPPVPSERRVTAYHSLPSTTTLVAKREGEVVATVTIIRDGTFGMPAEDLIDLSMFRKPGKRMAEVSSLAIRSDLQGRSPDVMFYLSKYLFLYSKEYFGIDRFIIAVHPKRIPLFEGLFLFEPLHKKVINGYRFANNAPAVNATNNLETVEERFQRVYDGKPDQRNLYQFIFKTFTEREKASMEFPERPYATIIDPVLTPDTMDYFFNTCTQLFETMTDRQLRHLHAVYDHRDFRNVFPETELSSDDNRRNRIRFDMKCYGLVYPGDRNMPVFINILDVSESGMRVHSDIQLTPDISHTYFIVVGKQIVSTVKGVVRWSGASVYGVELTETDTKWAGFISYQHDMIVRVDSDDEHLLVAVS